MVEGAVFRTGGSGFGAGAAFAFRLLGGAETSGLFFPVPLPASAPVPEESSGAGLFAVSAAARCQGLGSSILNEIKHILSCQICLEVELPKTDLAKRRIAFYKRNGFALNDYPYIQPALSKGRHPLPLLLMTTDGTITPDRFAYIKTTLYQHVYNISPSDINTYLG